MADPSKNSIAVRAQPLLDSERRTEARYPTEDPVELEVLPGSSDSIYGVVLDVSRSGLRVALPICVDCGARVRLKLQNDVVIGEVRYCRSVSGRFHAGIRIQDLVRLEGLIQHIEGDLLSLFAIGKGLSVTEIIEMRRHLRHCDACRTCLAEKQALLHASSSPRLRRPFA